MLRKTFLPLCIFCTIVSLSASVCYAGRSQKPLSPIRITIVPTHAGVTPAGIKPGDVVEFKVTAVSFLDTQEMRIKVELSDGAELVDGNAAWSGPAAKNEEKVFIITVRASQEGKGKIWVHGAIPGSQGASFATESWYQLGADANASMKSSVKGAKPPVRKDSKGRDVIEYR
jgi:hypothetical protein